MLIARIVEGMIKAAMEFEMPEELRLANPGKRIQQKQIEFSLEVPKSPAAAEVRSR